MVNTDYKIEAIGYLLNEDCILKGFYPLIPYCNILVENLMQRGCRRKSDAVKCTDEELLQAGLPDMGMVALFRRFLVMYDPKAQKMREIASVSETPEEAEAFKELYLLPGVKSTRARLYMQAGFATLEEVAGMMPECLIAACQQTIDREGLNLKAPLMKEARTHIAVARAFTDAPED
ncbi:MAG: hypothetical protein IJX84_08150 [Clostridia bacterium]|nr:hypothetical protein [Clostridia bacterium]